MTTRPRNLRTRAQRREYRTRLFWSDKLAAAQSPEQEAAVRFDWLRSRIEQLPETRRGVVWTRVSETLLQLGEELIAEHDP